VHATSLDTGDLLGLRLRNLRLEARETLAQTAAATGVSESLLSRIENGHRRPARPLLERLATHFSVDIEKLTEGADATTARPARRTTQTSWPVGVSAGAETTTAGTLVLADVAIATALGSLRESLRGNDHVERYRACRALANLASQPFELLHEVSLRDDDPTVREATRQLLSTLVEAYVETADA